MLGLRWLLDPGCKNTMPWTFVELDPSYGAVSEGPVWTGSCLLFTHIQQSRILKYDPEAGSITTWRENTNYANGLAYDMEGRLYACEGGADENFG